jgi:hypothetical protein
LLRSGHILNVGAAKIAVPTVMRFASRGDLTLWYVRLTLLACVVGVLVGIIRVLVTLLHRPMLRRPVASNRPGLSKNWDTSFIVTDSAGQKLAYVYFEEEPGRAIGGEAAHQGRGAANRYGNR